MSPTSDDYACQSVTAVTKSNNNPPAWYWALFYRRQKSILHTPNGDITPGVNIILYFCLITSINMKTIALNNVVWREGRHFVAQCLNVDVSSFGDTKEEALTNLQEALELYFEDNDHPEVNYIHDAELIDSTLNYA